MTDRQINQWAKDKGAWVKARQVTCDPIQFRAVASVAIDHVIRTVSALADTRREARIQALRALRYIS